MLQWSICLLNLKAAVAVQEAPVTVEHCGDEDDCKSDNKPMVKSPIKVNDVLEKLDIKKLNEDGESKDDEPSLESTNQPLTLEEVEQKIWSAAQKGNMEEFRKYLNYRQNDVVANIDKQHQENAVLMDVGQYDILNAEKYEVDQSVQEDHGSWQYQCPGDDLRDFGRFLDENEEEGANNGTSSNIQIVQRPYENAEDYDLEMQLNLLNSEKRAPEDKYTQIDNQFTKLKGAIDWNQVEAVLEPQSRLDTSLRSKAKDVLSLRSKIDWDRVEELLQDNKITLSTSTDNYCESSLTDDISLPDVHADKSDILAKKATQVLCFHGYKSKTSRAPDQSKCKEKEKKEGSKEGHDLWCPGHDINDFVRSLEENDEEGANDVASSAKSSKANHSYIYPKEKKKKEKLKAKRAPPPPQGNPMQGVYSFFRAAKRGVYGIFDAVTEWWNGFSSEAQKKQQREKVLKTLYVLRAIRAELEKEKMKKWQTVSTIFQTEWQNFEKIIESAKKNQEGNKEWQKISKIFQTEWQKWQDQFESAKTNQGEIQMWQIAVSVFQAEREKPSSSQEETTDMGEVLQWLGFCEAISQKIQ